VIVFAVFGAAALGGALVMVGARNPVFSAMGLLTTMFSVAVFYVMNGAHFVAAIQVLIYAGAIMTLFLFVIMLIGVDKSVDRTESIPFQRPIAVVLGAGLLALIYVAARAAWVTGVGTGPDVPGTIENISEQLFDAWLIPFEATILLLTIAAVGTVALALFVKKSPDINPVPDDATDSAGETS
ncbi:MAG: NADH-quinone oxidoreductase subunit J family protein, partial [Acidimicrobiia bacterium]